MAIENMIARIRKGMEVHTADGQSLGKVVEVYLGTDPTASHPLCDEELCSRLEVQSGGLFKRRTVYVPYSAIADVGTDRVTLKIDAAAVSERPWNQKPRWAAG
jgi:uncharacterized protein YrrD